MKPAPILITAADLDAQAERDWLASVNASNEASNLLHDLRGAILLPASFDVVMSLIERIESITAQSDDHAHRAVTALGALLNHERQAQSRAS